MHFGFVGRAAGLSPELLVIGAGVAQIQTARQSQNPNDKGSLACWGDHPFATWSIKFGIFLYDNYVANGISNQVFQKALQEYIKQYGAPPPPPPGSTGS